MEEIIKKNKEVSVEYSPKVLEVMAKHFEQNHIVEHVLVDLGISRDTYYRWKKKYPEMALLHDIGKSKRTASLFDDGVEFKDGKREGNVQVWNTFMRNIGGWDKQDTTNSNINVENLQINNLSKSEVAKTVFAKLKFHKLIGDEDGSDSSTDGA